MKDSSIRHLLIAVALAALGLAGCTAEEPTGTHVNALTGAICTPTDSYMPRPNSHANANGGGAQCQGTGPGDNCDDLHSGKIDCIGDGNSGQGDDRKHPCTFPQPGCDAEGCCDGDMVDPPPVEPPPTDTPPTDPAPTPTDPAPTPTPEPIG
jgi:hypothetical protein